MTSINVVSRIYKINGVYILSTLFIVFLYYFYMFYDEIASEIDENVAIL